MYTLIFTTLLAATTLSAPTKTTAPLIPTPTFTCAKGLTPYLAHFEDLPTASSGRAHAVNPSPTPTPGVYKKLYYGGTDWYVVSNGYNTVPWNDSPTEVAVEGNMTARGRNAIINDESVLMYGGDYFNLRSLWVRSASAAAFTLEVRCFVLNEQGTTTAKEIDVNVPAVPLDVNSGYFKVQLTGAQQAMMAKSRECLFGDKNQTSFTLLDDVEYCYYGKPGNPY